MNARAKEAKSLDSASFISCTRSGLSRRRPCRCHLALAPWLDETLLAPTHSNWERLFLLGGVVLATMLTAPVVWLVRYAFRGENRARCFHKLR